MERIDHNRYLELIHGAALIEADTHGHKVLRLANGNYLKLFRVKRFFSSAQIFSYAQRFVRNARLLAAREVPTVVVVAGYNIPALNRSAVCYEPLVGNTLRSITATLDASTIEQLGAFVRELHDKGIYFRSLHLGNIILTPANQLGLIDISDLTIYRRSLSKHWRIRNFRHLFRVASDRDIITKQMDSFATGYNDPGIISTVRNELTHL